MRIFQPMLAFGGNLPPQLAITRELVRRGHEVRVYAFRAGRHRIEATGAEFVEFRGWHDDLDLTRPESDPVQDWAARTSLGASKRMWGAVVESLPALTHGCVQQLRQRPADVVVFDCLMNGAVIAAQDAGVPSVALGHFPYPLPVDGVPPVFSGLRPMVGPFGVMRDRAFNALTRRSNASGLPVLNRTRAEYDLAPLATWEEQLLAADAIYMLTAPELDFSTRATLPGNVHYVGPAFEPYPADWESPWPEDDRRPLVVISFSTTYMNQRALVQNVLDAVAPLRVRALLTTGPAIRSHELRLPSNARAVEYVPHRTVLPHASLVITHAGWQTVNAALADGVPLVCIPDSRDQPDNAARVVYARAGVRASKRTPPGKLRKTIDRALSDPALKRQAQKLAAALARSDGATTTAGAVETLVANGSTHGSRVVTG